jgi:hypothetical protein
MAGKPAEPRRPQGAQTGDRVDAGSHAEQGEPERSGPLTVERLAKRDGRALILYSIDPEPQSGP